MPIEDIFSISGRGTVVTGRIERGICKVGEEMEIVGYTPTAKTVITGVEMFKKLLDEGRGRPAYTVLQGIPAAVLYADHGCDRIGGNARRRGDGDAGRQCVAGN